MPDWQAEFAGDGGAFGNAVAQTSKEVLNRLILAQEVIELALQALDLSPFFVGLEF